MKRPTSGSVNTGDDLIVVATEGGDLMFRTSGPGTVIEDTWTCGRLQRRSTTPLTRFIRLPDPAEVVVTVLPGCQPRPLADQIPAQANPLMAWTSRK